MSNGSSNPIVGFFLGIGCLIGGYFLWENVGKPMRAKAAASVEWPTTDGQITHSEVHREERKRKKKAMFSMEIEYDYTLDGRKFEGQRVWFGDDYSSSSSSHFQAAVHRYPVGKAVKVHYDPTDPAESVLEPGPTWSASIWYLVGIGLMVVGALALGPSLFMLVILCGALFGTDRGSISDEFARGAVYPTDRRNSGDDDGDGIEIV